MKFCTFCIAAVLLITDAKHQRYVPKACYITPSKLSPQEASPCTQLECHHYLQCTVMTINELIDTMDSDSFKLIIFLPGTHFVQETRNSEWSVNPSSNITIKGIEENVTVFCKKLIIFVLIKLM